MAGKITDNPKLEAEGKGEKIAGKVQEKIARSRRSWGIRRAVPHASACPLGNGRV